jgi:HK97 family phage portal protein
LSFLDRIFSARATEPAVQLIAPAADTDASHEVRSDPPPVDWFEVLAGFGDGGTIAGPEISPQTALSVPAVRAACDLIAGICGTLPVNLFKPAAGGGKEVAADHPGQSIVASDASPWLDAGELRSALTLDALLWGAGYALVIRDSDGKPQELHRLLPTAVIARVDPNTSEPSYDYNVGTGGGNYSYRDVIVIRPIVRMDNIGAYGFQTGLAPIKTCREAIALCIALEQHAARLMRHGGRPSGVLTFPHKLGAETGKKIKTSWQAATSGRSAGGTAVLEEGGDFKPLAFSSVDQQFLQLREFQVLEISRAFGIPPPFLAEHGRATFSNFEQSSRQLTTFCLQPWFKCWAAAYRRVLLTDEDRKAGVYAAYDLDALLQGDLLARASAYSTMISSRIINPNEAREREHLPAYPAGAVFSNPNTSTAGPVIPANAAHGGANG